MSKKDASESANVPKGKSIQNDSSPLPGWPGYRTRDGRSGYDPIDTRTEAAHTVGTFIQYFFTGRLRIRNPFSLFLSGILGLVLVIPLILAIVEMLSGNIFSWNAWIPLLVMGIIGLAVVMNFIKNLLKFFYK